VAARPIAVFMHVATLGRYQQILDEALDVLSASEMYERVELVSINVVGDGPVVIGSPDPRVILTRRSNDVGAYEHPTLEAIQAYAQAAPRARVLYLNGLGGRYLGADHDNRAEWRRMLYFLFIERFQAALAVLETADVCGVEWVRWPMPHLTSNNWWASAAYLAELPSPSRARDWVIAQDLQRFGAHWQHAAVKARHAGEFWLGMNPNCRAHSLYPLDLSGLPRSQYGVVPWWELRSIPWCALARRQMQAGLSRPARLAFDRRWTQGTAYRLRRWLRAGRMRLASLRTVLNRRVSR
jgi:hypothetical protein